MIRQEEVYEMYKNWEIEWRARAQGLQLLKEVFEMWARAAFVIPPDTWVSC